MKSSSANGNVTESPGHIAILQLFAGELAYEKGNINPLSFNIRKYSRETYSSAPGSRSLDRMRAPDFRATALRAASRLPVLPQAFKQTLSLLVKGDDVSVADLARVVEQDVAMSGHLISIANSALYSRASSACSVRQA